MTQMNVSSHRESVIKMYYLGEEKLPVLHMESRHDY